MEELINFKAYPVSEVLNKLLQDKTTNKNIVFATDSYKERGYQEASQITEKSISEFSDLELQPRVYKATKEQSDRTRKKAEVFTPLWICEEMNKLCIENFSGDWKKSVDITTLEITCGEAPFLVSRYDATRGEKVSIENRVGILDRKLKLICENTDNEKDWLKYAKKAYKSTYGYELQGDNLLIARINLLMTFCEYFLYKFNREADKKDIKAIAEIIAWNLWQMDGLKDTVPFGEPENDFVQLSFFDEPEEKEEKSDCIIKNWKTNKEIKFKSIKEGKEMKFDFVIGNPPYQEEDGGAQASARPVYQHFFKESIKISDNVELIMPTRWYTGGKGLDEFRNDMLNDNHIKTLYDYPHTNDIFPRVNIRGGICIVFWSKSYNNTNSLVDVYTYSDNQISHTKRSLKTKNLDIFVRNYEAITILNKVVSSNDFNQFSDYVSSRKPFGLATNFNNDDKFKNEITGLKEPVICYYKGLKTGYIERENINSHKEWIDSWKVMTSRANNIGTELNDDNLNAFVIKPNTVCTESYMLIGVNLGLNEESATNLVKFFKSKFARFMHSLAKASQDATSKTYRFVPLQDFTENSDIDWTKPIAEIDKQLYKKYNLSQEEIDFIESHVKEME